MRTPIDRWIHRFGELQDALPVYRVLFGLWILIAVVPRGQWLKDVPDSLRFPPPGTPFLFGSTPPDLAVDSASVFMAACAGLLISGYLPRFAALGVGISLLVLETWMYSFGKIDHGIFLVAVPLLLAFSNWGPRPVADARGHDRFARSWPPALLALVIGLAMLSSAIPKVLTGWLSLDISATRYHVVRNVHVTGREGPLTQPLLEVDLPVMWIATDLATVGLELFMVLAVLSPRLFRLACAAAALFHLGVLLLMDISSHLNVIAYGAFVRWDPLLRFGLIRWIAGVDDPPGPWRGLGAALVGATVGVVSVWIQNPFEWAQLLVFGRPVVGPMVVAIGGVVGITYLGFRVLRPARNLFARSAT